MFTLRCRQVDIFAIISSPLSTIPAINYRSYWQLIIAGVFVTGDKLIAGVMESKTIQDMANNLSIITTTPAIIYIRCH
jgi:hypothetical protein